MYKHLKYCLTQMVDCTVKCKSAAGLEVAILPSNTSALIPTVHLSDHHDNWPILLAMYNPGDVIEGAMCWQHDNTVMLSKKRTLMEAHRNEIILKTFEELQVLYFYCLYIWLGSLYFSSRVNAISV